MSVRGSAAALRKADEALREALAALTKVSVAEHLLPGVEVRPVFFSYGHQDLCSSILLDRHEWPEKPSDRHWMVDQGTGRWWHVITIGRTALGRDLTPEQRAYRRSDDEMREMMVEYVTEILTELGAQRVAQAVAMVAREAVEGDR